MTMIWGTHEILAEMNRSCRVREMASGCDGPGKTSWKRWHLIYVLKNEQLRLGKGMPSRRVGVGKCPGAGRQRMY